MENLSHRRCRENQNILFISSNSFFPSKIVPFMR